MSTPKLTIPPLDPHMKTGPTRILSGPVRFITPVLDTPYGEFATWLYVGASGNVTITTWGGSTITMIGLASGVWHPIYSVAVNSSGTTATGIMCAS